METNFETYLDADLVCYSEFGMIFGRDEKKRSELGEDNELPQFYWI